MAWRVPCNIFHRPPRKHLLSNGNIRVCAGTEVTHGLCTATNNAHLYRVMEKTTKGGLQCLVGAVNHKSSKKIGCVAQHNVPIVKKKKKFRYGMHIC